jgi:hypothetical protein
VPKLLHVLNGDCARIILEQTGLPGDTVVWADVLHDGPAPSGLSPEEWRTLRGGQLTTAASRARSEFLAGLRRADEQLARHSEYDEVVFWFEHDLFDQLLLIRHLDWISTQAGDRSVFRLICVGEFPGRPDFAGLGELRPDELATLFPARQPITDAHVALGSKLWRAFGAPDPRPLVRLTLDSDTSLLPYVAGALKRHLEEFPSDRDGLARTERQILTVVGQGHRTAVDAFRANARLEERVFMGDLTFFGILKRLTTGRAPLLEHEGEWPIDAAPTGVFAVTDAARRVLSGDADYVTINGIDRWMGGVHLTDGTYRWTGSTLVARPDGDKRLTSD